MEFQCVHTPYQIHPLFTTQCLASGQWSPHPGDVCGQYLTIVVHCESLCTCTQCVYNYDTCPQDYLIIMFMPCSIQGSQLWHLWEQ